MKVIVDSHVMVWLDSDSKKLSGTAKQVLNDPSGELIYSVATYWELGLKIQLGKLKLSKPLPEVLREQCSVNSFEILPINLHHVQLVVDLPLIHRDPFDRMLIAQAKYEHATLLTDDPFIRQYAVPVLW
jgi:PIN domain nuclease of toxin-antitoxin system